MFTIRSKQLENQNVKNKFHFCLFANVISGVSGDVAINAKGNRVPVFVFSNRQGGNWVPIVEIDQTKPQNESVKIFTLSVVWPGGTTAVPLNEPKCGFHGEKCVVPPTGK